MPIIREVCGNLLTAKEKFIAQQCNCVTVKSHGLSAMISQQFKWADPYSTRQHEGLDRNCAASKAMDKPGTVRILSSPSGPFKVVCLFAQWAPGKPGDYAKYYPKDYDDTSENRLKWFKECLKVLDEDKTIDSPVAIPYQIGCGLAGGKWSQYYKALEMTKTEVVLYNLKRKRRD